MKKIIAVLMVFMTLLCSASCGNADDNATRGYVSFPNSQIGDKNTSGGEAALYKYHTFEMMCKKATNVVIATYNMYPEINANQSIVGGKSIYKRWNFDVQENIFGETEENINVYMPSLRGYTGTTETGAIYFDESNVHMYHGHTYLLFLTKFSSPYYSKGDYIRGCMQQLSILTIYQTALCTVSLYTSIRKI
jgi:hypothetical protein